MFRTRNVNIIEFVREGRVKISPIHILKHKFKLDKPCNKINWHFFLSSITKGVDHLFILKGVVLVFIQIAWL